MVILTGFYNAEKYIQNSIRCIMAQEFEDFTCYITSDRSTDNSVNLVKELIKDDNRFILVEDSDKKLYQVGNFDTTIRHNSNISDNEVLIEVDGDDFLPDRKVFTRINNVYKDPNVWVTNGSFMYANGQPGFSSPQRFDDLRAQVFTASHIRTWRAFLWRSIKEEDLRDENNNYWQWCGDLCFMYPMLEMSTTEHYKFLPEINYVYNSDNSINEHKVNMNMVNTYTDLFRGKQKYNKLVL